MFLWVTTTAAGERVEPEVYCSTAFLVRGADGTLKSGSATRSRLSTSISAGALPGSERAQPTTSSTTAVGVSSTGGAQSCRAAEARPAWAPHCGTGSGTLTDPASNAG